MRAKVFLVIASILLTNWVSASTLCCSLLVGSDSDSTLNQSNSVLLALWGSTLSGSDSNDSDQVDNKPCHGDTQQEFKTEAGHTFDYSVQADCECEGCAQQNFVFETFSLSIEHALRFDVKSGASSFLGYIAQIYHPPIQNI